MSYVWVNHVDVFLNHVGDGLLRIGLSLTLIVIGRLTVPLLLLDLNNRQVQHRNGYLVGPLDELLFHAQVVLLLPLLVELVILLLQLLSLGAKLFRLFKQFQEGPLPVVALAQLNFELLAHGFVHLVVVVQLVEVVDQFLVVFNG